MNNICIEDLFLLLVFVMYVIAGYYFMKRLDKKVNKIKYTQKVLVYQEEKKSTDHNIEYSSDYESSKSYWDPFISCGKD